MDIQSNIWFSILLSYIMSSTNNFYVSKKIENMYPKVEHMEQTTFYFLFFISQFQSYSMIIYCLLAFYFCCLGYCYVVWMISLHSHKKIYFLSCSNFSFDSFNFLIDLLVFLSSMILMLLIKSFLLNSYWLSYINLNRFVSYQGF